MKTKTHLIQIRVSHAERDLAKQEAEKSGISFSEWVRRKIIETGTLESRVDALESALARIEQRIK